LRERARSEYPKRVMSNDLNAIDFAETRETTVEGEAAIESPVVQAPPIHSRFLFVDVAAQRAKQLRRGARPRVVVPTEGPFKLERVAMTEVASGLVDYTLPHARSATGEGVA
jgi:DNA-directed RNA polymerase subunit K/omega